MLQVYIAVKHRMQVLAFTCSPVLASFLLYVFTCLSALQSEEGREGGRGVLWLCVVTLLEVSAVTAVQGMCCMLLWCFSYAIISVAM